MGLIAEVRKHNRELAVVLRKHKGIRKIVEELYPDRAHFVYELLQNAEDTEATWVRFSLTREQLMLEHNGRPFDDSDVYAITDIGEGTKAADDDKIGRFGIGFKAVFAYSETPQIYCRTVSFGIKDLVVPYEIDEDPKIGEVTRFEFPLNSKKTPRDRAYLEILETLKSLSGDTLLFLRAIEAIEWTGPNGVGGSVKRIEHPSNIVEIQRSEGEETEDRYWLRFSKPVKELPNQSVAAAFLLMPKTKSAKRKMRLSRRSFKITPVRGKVCVYFPAEKEISELRFHIHGPFVPELSRASIKATDANQTLYTQLSELVREALHAIRDYGLLTPDFLGTLPNTNDNVPERYCLIREAIVEEMNGKPLVPDHNSKMHRPGRKLLQARAPLKGLLKETDLKFLVGKEVGRAHWAIGAIRNSDQDRFLRDLDILTWDVDEFVGCIKERSTEDWWTKAEPEFHAWLEAKPVEWHRRFYALLYQELGDRRGLHKLSRSSIVKLEGGGYSTGADVHFHTGAGGPGKGFQFVDKRVYNGGANKKERVEARQFLEGVGVRDISDEDLVLQILNERYGEGSDDVGDEVYAGDFERFVKVVEDDPDNARLFEEYAVLFTEDNEWRTADEMYLDEPYVASALASFYGSCEDDARWPLSGWYANCDLDVDRVVDFCRAIGVVDSLNVARLPVNAHPRRKDLMSDYLTTNARWTETGINEDWIVPGLKGVLDEPDLECSRLIWSSLYLWDTRACRARYRPNQTWNIKTEPSSLVIALRESAWVPQMGGGFVKPAQVVQDLLPEGFRVDPECQWLRAIGFAEQEQRASEEQREQLALAQSLGLHVEDDAQIELLKRLTKLPQEALEDLVTQYEERVIDLPTRESADPDGRHQRAKDLAKQAREKEKQVRPRTVTVSTGPTKDEADQYLRSNYTNADGRMVCQICNRELPFRLADGSYYFERVELIPGLSREHPQNHLALCPNHGAMWRYANGSRESLAELVDAMKGNLLTVELAGRPRKARFTETHVVDLRAVLEAELEEATSD